MIKVSEHYYINADSHCYTVGKPKVDKKGKEFFDAEKYYTTMRQAIEGVIQLEMRRGVADDTITTLRQYIDQLDALKSEIDASLSEIDGSNAV